MKTEKGKNIVWHEGAVSAADREILLRQRGCVIWFTGYSGSGKSTLARACESSLMAAGHLSYVLDGDNVRHGLNSDLSFTANDRKENIRRIAEVAKLFADVGIVTLTAFISPFRADRDAARAVIGKDKFIEVFLDVALNVCENRDPKGLYRNARAGHIADFTGISSPYEPPEKPDLTIDTSVGDVASGTGRIIAFLVEKGFLPG